MKGYDNEMKYGLCVMKIYSRKYYTNSKPAAFYWMLCLKYKKLMLQTILIGNKVLKISTKCMKGIIIPPSAYYQNIEV